MVANSIEADYRIEEMVRQAALAGMPRDQVERFVTAGYVILPSMMAFHAAARHADRGEVDEIALGGTRGPGKSYAVMQQVGIDDMQRVPGLKFLFLRKFMKSAAESVDDLVRKVFAFTPHRQTAQGVELPNDSRMVIGGYRTASDIDKYLGIEYDGIVIEEATQLQEDHKNKIRGSMRTSKPNWKPRLYPTTNADGIGLQWFKKTYVTPWREGREKNTRFFQAHYYDNPFLDAGYVRWLEGLKGPLGKAWRDADWDAFAGMAFPTFNYERHVTEPFEIPTHWIKWRAVDEGYTAPWCCLWFARNPDTRRQYVFREAYQPGLTLEQQCSYINDMTLPDEKIAFTFADPAMWQTKNMTGKVYSAADEYKDNGVPLTRADNDRINGKRKIDGLLADLPDGEPGIQFFTSVPHVIEQLQTLAHDPVNVEDVDTTQEDHAYDTLRYGQTNERKTTAPTTPPKQGHPLRNMKGL